MSRILSQEKLHAKIAIGENTPKPLYLMRIAYLTGEYLRPTHTFIQREVETLRSDGLEVHTFSVRPTDPEELVSTEQKAEQAQTFNILPIRPFAILKAHTSLLLSAPARYWQALKLAWRSQSPGIKALIYQLFYFIEAGVLAQELRSRKIDHLHNHFADSSCTVSMLAAALANIRFSFTLHGPYIFFEPYRWRLDLKIRQALFVICISHYCRSQAMFLSDPEHWNKLHIIHCGIDLNRYRPVPHPSDQKRLLYIGRLSAAKGVPILLQAIASLTAQHPEVLLTIIGDGPDRQALETQSAQLGLTHHLKFVGYQSQESVCQYLQACDIFVLPSFAEGLPVVLMEAMATGVPVIATAIAAISELVEDGVNGYLVPPGAVEPLAHKLDQLLSNAQLRQSLGEAGRRKVEQAFNLHQEVDSLKRIMSLALTKSSANADVPNP
jgi:colanic acid/amylovoran biosynthesis glycosyltransferase